MSETVQVPLPNGLTEEWRSADGREWEWRTPGLRDEWTPDMLGVSHIMRALAARERALAEARRWEERTKQTGGMIARAWVPLLGWWQYQVGQQEGESLADALTRAIDADRAHDAYCIAEMRRLNETLAEARQRLEWVAAALHGDPIIGAANDEPLVQQVLLRCPAERVESLKMALDIYREEARIYREQRDAVTAELATLRERVGAVERWVRAGDRDRWLDVTFDGEWALAGRGVEIWVMPPCVAPTLEALGAALLAREGA